MRERPIILKFPLASVATSCPSSSPYPLTLTTALGMPWPFSLTTRPVIFPAAVLSTFSVGDDCARSGSAQQSRRIRALSRQYFERPCNIALCPKVDQCGSADLHCGKGLPFREDC